MSATLEMLRTKTYQQVFFANNLIRQAKVYRAELIMQSVLRKNLLALFADPSDSHGWPIGDCTIPTIDCLLLNLIEYHYQSDSWKQWQQYFLVINHHSYYDRLPIINRIFLEAAYDYSQLKHNVSLSQVIQRQLKYSEVQKLPPHIRTFLHLVVGYAAMELRDEVFALSQITQGKQISTYVNEPFYAILLDDLEASIYYMLNQHRMEHYHRAIKLFNELELNIREINEGYDFLHVAYTLGWIYAELGKYDEAFFHLQRGRLEAINTNKVFRLAQYNYGLGFVYYSVADYGMALSSLYAALEHFVDKSYVLSAACLNLIASVFIKLGNNDKALERLHYAQINLQKGDNPIQLHHVYRQFTNLYARTGDWLKAAEYFAKLYWIRIKYNVPLLPY